ncbi:unnamed protein product, partial [Urochloa humidicola]
SLPIRPSSSPSPSVRRGSNGFEVSAAAGDLDARAAAAASMGRGWIRLGLELGGGVHGRDWRGLELLPRLDGARARTAGRSRARAPSSFSGEPLLLLRRGGEIRALCCMSSLVDSKRRWRREELASMAPAADLGLAPSSTRRRSS